MVSAIARISPNQRPRHKHHHNSRREMNLKALAVERLRHILRPLPRRTPPYPPFAYEPPGEENKQRNCDVHCKIQVVPISEEAVADCRFGFTFANVANQFSMYFGIFRKFNM